MVLTEKRINRIVSRSFSAALCVFCIGLVLAVAGQVHAGPPLFHGLRMNKNCFGSKCVGSRLDCFIKVNYNDDAGDTTEVFDCADFIHPGPGEIRIPATGNLYIIAVGGNTTAVVGGSLPALIGPGGTMNNGLPGNPGNGFIVFSARPVVVDATHPDLSYVIQPGDPNPIADQARAHYKDYCNIPPGTSCSTALSLMTASGSSSVIHPEMVLTASANRSSVCPSANTMVTYTYSVANTGDANLSKPLVIDDQCNPVTYVSGNTDGDFILDADIPGTPANEAETWIFECTRVVTATTVSKVTVTATSADCPVSDFQFVTVTATDVSCTAEALPPTICAGCSSTLTVTPSPGPSSDYTFLWSTGETTQSIVVSPIVATEYCCTVTRMGGNCSSTCCVTVNIGRDDCICVVVIDEDTIDNGIHSIEDAADSHNVTPAFLVNDDIPTEVGNPCFRWCALFPGDIVKLPGGQVDDEGVFALPPNPPWPLADFVAGIVPQNQLDEIEDVMPLRNQDLHRLIGRTCVAVVYDSDISMNYLPIKANLQGARYGLFYFTLLNVIVPSTIPESGSSSSLYELLVRVESCKFENACIQNVNVVVRDHEPDVATITLARWCNNVLTVRGHSDTAPTAVMTVSIDGFVLEAPMTFHSGHEYRYTVNTSTNLVGRRISVQTAEGGANHGFVGGCNAMSR